MVRCDNVSVSYTDQFGIKNLNMTLEEGTTCAIVGQSGCGKTTLLHAVAGLCDITSGHVYVDGMEVFDVRRDTAVILQEDGLLPWKTVYDNVALGLKVQGVSKDVIDKTVRQLLEELKIIEHEHKYPIRLSGGERKRVAIARALALKPYLLLMDEPTGSLDMITKERFQDQILNLFREHGFTMMVVTHDIEEAVYLGQKIIVMKDGQITATYENPTFMKTDIRHEMLFYEMCLKVRKELSL